MSTSALSVLPAVLLHLSIGDRYPRLVRAGYCLSGLAVAMHAGEHLLPRGDWHGLALLATTAGFGLLTLAAGALLLHGRGGGRRELTSRLVGAMSLFLFAMSLVHFRTGEGHSAWSAELVMHHAGIPLALVVLLQEYRFILLDVFVRVLATAALAAGFIFAAAWLQDGGWWDLSSPHSPFHQGVFLVAAGCFLVAYAVLQGRMQRLLTRLLFGRREVERTLERLRKLCASTGDEREYVRAAAGELARLLGAELRTAASEGLPAEADPEILFPTPVYLIPSPLREALEAESAEVVVPLRLAPGEVHYILLGHRTGGRRYLSEDLQAIERVAGQILADIEYHRTAEMRRLVEQAEFRALASQIHPHFLFNALNAIYGVIPREADGARRAVLNLADILRYFLQSDRTFIPLEEELRIVRAYLEIEQLRLGPRLRSQIRVDESCHQVRIPLLSLQPLVENAVKHAISSSADGGEIRVIARRVDEAVLIRVEDTGPGFQDRPADNPSRGQGVGLSNVARRLKLCYGPEGGLHIDSGPAGAAVEFRIPTATLVEA